MFEKDIICELKRLTKLKDFSLEIPPNPSMGDFAFPCFSLAKKLKKNPGDIAKVLADEFSSKVVKKVKVVGPYLNFFIDKTLFSKKVLREVFKSKEFGKSKPTKKKILIEYPGPNTNKPLHLGHVRNICLGSSLCNILSFGGNKIIPVNINNDRGIHICKSMLAYQKFGKNDSPEKSNLKPDFFVGKYYVLFNLEAKKNKNLEDEAKNLLEKWERRDPETIKLWKRMNSWAFRGFKETYKKFNISFDKEYFESEMYKKGKKVVLDGVKSGVFTKDVSGAVKIDLSKEGFGEKILLRSNDTSVYVTQDLYLANARFKDYDFDKLIYVVATEQNYHFQVLFSIFKKLKYKFADKCYHFAYGMVNLTTGKMKSREGTVVDADSLIEDLTVLAKKEISSRHKTLSKKELNSRANKIAMSAIRFYIVKYDPIKDFLFNPEKSLSFEGETGPYIQYVYARINSIIKKSKVKMDDSFLSKIDLSLLEVDQEFDLVKKISNFPKVLNIINNNYKISLLAHYLLELSQDFNSYYHGVKIIQDDVSLRNVRLALIFAIQRVIKIGLELLGIDIIEEM